MICLTFIREPPVPAFILQACRTPWGALGGRHQSRAAPVLAAAALGEVLAGFDPERLEGFVLGQAVQAGAGPNPARVAADLAGLSPALPAFTLNQGRASGLMAILQACRGEEDLMAAGGVESSSCAPYLLPSARWGTRMGEAPVLDALLVDGPWPPRLGSGSPAGAFPDEFAPGETGRDDLPEPCSPADGAAMVLLGSEQMARSHPPLARILGWGRGEEAEAVRRALLMAGLGLDRMDRLELDHPEAWPGLGAGRVNVRGGPGALGLALGAEGARKLVTLVRQLIHGKLRYGLAALASEGSGLALVVERT